MRPPTTPPASTVSPDIEDAYGGGTPLRRRLLLSGLITSLALVGVVGTLAWRQYDDARRSAVDDARARVILAGAMIDSYFGGQISTLSAIAQSPPVLSSDTTAMQAYFKRVESAGGGSFMGGLGWIDRTGVFRASSAASPERELDVSDRSYYKSVMRTGAPFVSEGLASRSTRRHMIVMAVPTRDANGRLTGALAGALLTDGFQINSGSLDLGFDGLAVLDRSGRAVLHGFSRPRNTALQRELQSRQVGLLPNVRGLDGRSGHLVAFSTAQLPGWTIALDRPRADVFAAARRALILDLGLLAAAAVIAFGLMGRLLLRARREAEDRSARARQRGELSHAFSAASLADEVAHSLAAGLEASFPHALSLVALETDDRPGLELSAAGGAWSLDDQACRLVVSEACARVYDSGFAFSLESRVSLRDDLPQLQEALGDACGSLYAAPVRVRGSRPTGALCLLFPGEHSLNDAERAHVAWYADETARALTRARSYEHEHVVATSLQRSLLSQVLPQIEGVELLGHYESGSAGLEVGGDWYDVVRCADGTVQISVGDVAGRGLTAAVLMGQMRNAFRAYAYDHDSPAEVLRRMRRHVTGEEMATALCMTLDPYTRELTYASAGHLPSLHLAGEGGEVARLDQACAPPLGYVGPDAICEATVPLSQGSTVVAYTDGLIERRDWSLDEGIDLLTSVLASSTAETPEALAARIVHGVARRVGSGDDMAFLIIRSGALPGRLDIEVPGEPTELADLRRRLRAWLTLRGLHEAAREDAVLSIGEAFSNAVEHGYGQQPRTIRVVVDHSEAALKVVVEDHGDWHPPTSNARAGERTTITLPAMPDAKRAYL